MTEMIFNAQVSLLEDLNSNKPPESPHTGACEFPH